MSALDVVASLLVVLGEELESAREQAVVLLRSLYIKEELFGLSPLLFPVESSKELTSPAG